MIQRKKKQSNKVIGIELIILALVLIIPLVFIFQEAIETTAKISISCDRNIGTCKFTENKVFTHKKEFYIPINDISMAKKNIIGCSKGSCNYNIKIFLKDRRSIEEYYTSLEDFIDKVELKINKFITYFCNEEKIADWKKVYSIANFRANAKWNQFKKDANVNPKYIF